MTMRYFTRIRRAATLLIAATLTSTAPVAAQDALTAHVENPLDLARKNEVARISWDDLQAALPAASPRAMRVVDEGARQEEVMSQPIDEDGDGDVDALLFLTSLWPLETRTYRIESAAPAEATPRVHIRHHAPRDDVAWENEHIAFRTYGEGLWELEDLVSSGFDAWTKRTRDLIVDKWYADGHYHDDTGEGADFFMVGASLGAGAPGLWIDGRLYRAPNFAGHRILANGPIRAVVELEHGPFEAGTLDVTETRRITIDAGQPLFKVETAFNSDDSGPLTVATGLVERAGVVRSTSIDTSWQWISLWGPVSPPGHGEFGTAVVVDGNASLRNGTGTGHTLALMDAYAGERTTYYVASAWTAAGEVTSVESWWDVLDEAARRLASPLRISLQP